MDDHEIEQTGEPSELTAGLGESQRTTHPANFSQPHVPLETFTKDLTKSLKRVFTTKARPYDGVYVLLLRWEEDDLGIETEIKALDKVFRQTYNYVTERAIITSEDSFENLESTIVEFRKKHDNENHLLILYYAGHGALVKGNRSIWAAKQSGRPKLDWSELQERLLRAKSDVLFILDCCYASTAGTRGAIRGAKEVLAACSMEDETIGVRADSFTRNLIEELKSGAGGDLTTWRLNNLMISRRAKDMLRFTPRHFALTDETNPRIEIRPLSKFTGLDPTYESLQVQNLHLTQPPPSLTDSVSTISTADRSSLTEDRILLAITLKDSPRPPDARQWISWLREGAPDIIKSITASYEQVSVHPVWREGTIQREDPMTWRQGLPSIVEPGRLKRVEENLVRTENAFSSGSTLLLVSLSLPLWTFLPDNPAYSFVGYINSSNLSPQLTPTLSRAQSMSEIKNGLVQIDRQHWWYKWYLAVVWVTVPAVCWPALGNKAVGYLLLLVILMSVVTATPAGLLLLVDIPNNWFADMNLTEIFRERKYE